MNRNSTAAALVGLFCVAANAQEAEQELMQLERDWSAAFLKHDAATIDRILAEDYLGTDGRGIMTSKADEMEEAKPPKPGDSVPFIILDESITDLEVRIYGNVAVINGRVIEKVRAKEEEGEIQYRRTTVWVMRQGRWQCVSFHGSRIAELPPQRECHSVKPGRPIRQAASIDRTSRRLSRTLRLAETPARPAPTMNLARLSCASMDWPAL